MKYTDQIKETTNTRTYKEMKENRRRKEVNGCPLFRSTSIMDGYAAISTMHCSKYFFRYVHSASWKQSATTQEMYVVNNYIK